MPYSNLHGKPELQFSEAIHQRAETNFQIKNDRDADPVISPIAAVSYCEDAINQLMVNGFSRKQIAASAKLSTSTINKLLNHKIAQPHRITLKKLFGFYYAVFLSDRLKE